MPRKLTISKDLIELEIRVAICDFCGEKRSDCVMGHLPDWKEQNVDICRSCVRQIAKQLD